MPYYFFHWTDQAVAHIAEHDVTPEEFEAVVCNPEKSEVSRSSDRMIAFGRVRGRDIACVYEFIDTESILPVTADEV